MVNANQLPIDEVVLRHVITEQDQNLLNSSLSPTSTVINDVDVTHEEDAYTAVTLNVTLIVCVLMAYYVKSNRMYYLPESAASMLIGVIIGGIARFLVTDLTLFTFSPEFFFFVLLPPIIFEAGYSLDQKLFFKNIGAITLYAMLGTIISTFIVGYLMFWFGQLGIITGVSRTNPMESLLFGALISAVDPVATLSIMGSPELNCNQLLYSLVFGESVLNDAIAVVLFKTFHKYYDPSAPDLTKSEIPSALLSFITMTVLSILVGTGLGLITSFIYKHTMIRDFPKLESTLLFLFCYCCYATAEALELSGIMALFFNGIILSHYNSYNLSSSSRQAAEQIFATLATVTETIVFLYMGMGVFTGKFGKWSFSFASLAMFSCLLGRFLNIFPISWLSNRFRKKSSRITFKMQFVLWFAGLRGAIAFALAMNMPGPNRETYESGTLSICVVTTVICGGFTEKMLRKCGMKQDQNSVTYGFDDDSNFDEEGKFITNEQTMSDINLVYKGLKGLWTQFDDTYLKPYFGGSNKVHQGNCQDDDHVGLGAYELTPRRDVRNDDDSGCS